MSEQRNIAERLLKIADACRRADGTYIPLGEQLQEAADELASLRAQLAEAQRYATNFLESFVHQHCNPVHDWEPLPELIGVLTQIDNATTVVREYKAQLASARKAITELCDVIEEDEEHGGGADETDCPICTAMRVARAAALTDEKEKAGP